jgi:hypothetical protein
LILNIPKFYRKKDVCRDLSTAQLGSTVSGLKMYDVSSTKLAIFHYGRYKSSTKSIEKQSAA